MSDLVYASFLKSQIDRARRLVQTSDRVTLTPLQGQPPYCWLVRFSCVGLVKSRRGVAEHHRWALGVRFPEDYLRARVHVAEVLTWLGPQEVWHPNVSPPFVCIDLRAGMPLDELVFTLYDLLTWNVYGVGDDGLNRAAAQWARHQPAERFPLDRRPLLRANTELSAS